MNKPIIFFAHANGFPGQSYQKLLGFLESDFQVDFIENVGHQDDYLGKDNWQDLAVEVEHYMKSTFSQPVIGVGHSLGGVLHLITALKCPELYKELILLDSPLYGPLKSVLLKLFKKFNLMHKITPSQSSARRRAIWPDKQAAYEYFKHKSLYKHFDEQCLQDYVEYGLQSCVGGGVKLRALPEVEGKIFENLPDNLACKKPKMPVTFIHATQSHVISNLDLKHLKQKFTVASFEGSHLFPFEKPEQTANYLKQLLQQHTYCPGL